MVPKVCFIQAFVLLSITLLSSFNLWGQDYRWTHYGLRPLGMGNAYVAIADDFNALFYNPAGLARIKEWDGELINPTLEIAGRTSTAINEVLTSFKGGGEDQTKKIISFIKKQSGKAHHAAIYETPHLIFKNWGFGIGIEESLSFVTHNIEVELNFLSPRAVMPFVVAGNFLENRLSLGVAVKGVVQMGIEKNLNVSTLSDLINSSDLATLFEAGYGIGIDLGLLFTPVETHKPTLGVSLTDLGNTSFQVINFGKVKPSAPAARPSSLNVGFSIRPLDEPAYYLSLSLDSHLNTQAVHYSHKLNLGMEFGLGDTLKLQTGLKDGFLTGGVQIDVGILSLRAVTYAVDHGIIVGQKDDFIERRYAVQLKLLI